MTSDKGHIPTPPSAKRLALLTLGALVVGTTIVFGAILPVEFGFDPLGVAKLTGLDRLRAPQEVAFQPADGESIGPRARDYTVAYRTDTVEIPLQGVFGPLFANELEYKVRMDKDATLTYAWSVEPLGGPDDFYYAFHGHTLDDDPDQITVANYREGTAANAAGALVAPFEGVHGWYFVNQSAKPVVIHLKLSGFYDLIPPGETGNLNGIIANVPAESAVAE